MTFSQFFLLASFIWIAPKASDRVAFVIGLIYLGLSVVAYFYHP